MNGTEEIFPETDDGDILDEVLAWAEDHLDFDTEFVESLAEYYDKHGELTEGQSKALRSIAMKWKIM